MSIVSNIRKSVISYLFSQSENERLEAFLFLVKVCLWNTKGLFLPSRTVGIGRYKGKFIKDSPIHDFAEEFVLETLAKWNDCARFDVEAACTLGKFDFIGNAFKFKVFNKIRSIQRSHEEDWVDMFDENAHNYMENS